MSKKTGKNKPAPGVKGTLDITRSGMELQKAGIKMFWLRPQDFNKAMHGDTVMVKIKESAGRRIEGVIQEVLERKQTEFIGNIEVYENFAFFKPDSQKPMPDFYISIKNLNGAKNNDRVVVNVP